MFTGITRIHTREGGTLMSYTINNPFSNQRP
jgi:hypothetical protein